MKAKVFFTRVEVEEAPKSQIDSPRSSPENNASAQAKEQKLKDQFFKGCIEALLMDRKDRITVSGQNKLHDTLNKLLMNHTDIAK